MNISDDCLDLIKPFEGCELTAYPDPATGGEPWTIGYGHTGCVKPGDSCTAEEAMEYLRRDVRFAEAAVRLLVKVPISQPQFDALVSFTFNCGQTALANSTLLRMLNAGNAVGAAAQFDRWNKGPNGPMPGLTRRRAAERALFETVA